MGINPSGLVGVKAVVTKENVVLQGDSGNVLETLPIIPATLDHKNFILATWVKSYPAKSRSLHVANHTGCMAMRRADFMDMETRISEAKWTESWVVSSPDNEYTIHAWISCSDGSLHHIYVNPDLRFLGIGGGLVEAFLGKEYATHKPWPKTPKGHICHWRVQ